MDNMVGTNVETDQRSALRKVVLAGFLGTAIEWYDFVIFGSVAALVFNQLFFPNEGPVVGVLASLGTFAVGFVARPLGGLFFGQLGDRIGRRPALVITMTVMGVSTLAIGLLPSYHSIGVLAPILLVLLRLIQGFSLGGEFGGVATLLLEHAPRNRRGRVGSWAQVGGLVGPLVGTIVLVVLTSAMSKEAFRDWGWRIPFLVSVALIIVSIFVRRHVHESPVFTRLRTRQAVSKKPLRDVLRNNLKGVLCVFGLMCGNTILFYTGIVFIVSYTTKEIGLSSSGALVLNIAFLVAAAIAAYVTGSLTDRVGRRKVAAGGAIAGIVFIFPAFALLHTGSLPVMCVTMAVLGAIEGTLYGFQPAYFGELFRTEQRYAGISAGVQLATVVVGSTAPLIGVLLLSWSGGGTVGFSIYIVAVLAFTLLAALWAGETFKKDLEDASDH
ncbi:MFS transporter [Amycolatopsis jejuensis]|uniref:MFS transporter n=1 Tax=Amycolatopsis jejuensis TaxID=330084 RepID=UPI00068D6745|nr:MFS transporter [Amycolatopsis jejuensis]